MSALAKKTITVKAGQTLVFDITGSWFRCFFTNGTFGLTCGDEEPLLACYAGLETRYPKTFTRLTFDNTANAFDLKVDFAVGAANITTQAGILLMKEFPSYIEGNLGDDGPSQDANGFISVGSAANLIVPGTRNGNSRKQIVFSVSSASDKALGVEKKSGRSFCRVGVGSTLTFVTDADFVLNGLGGTALVIIGESYYVA